ncbi:hypothetical protein Q7P37_002116 [Cladosporium fusiforme]
MSEEDCSALCEMHVQVLQAGRRCDGWPEAGELQGQISPSQASALPSRMPRDRSAKCSAQREKLRLAWHNGGGGWISTSRADLDLEGATGATGGPEHGSAFRASVPAVVWMQLAFVYAFGATTVSLSPRRPTSHNLTTRIRHPSSDTVPGLDTLACSRRPTTCAPAANNRLAANLRLSLSPSLQPQPQKLARLAHRACNSPHSTLCSTHPYTDLPAVGQDPAQQQCSQQANRIPNGADTPARGIVTSNPRAVDNHTRPPRHRRQLTSYYSHIDSHETNVTSQPLRSRALRIHDENMLPPQAVNGALPGKTLHQRTKSVPAFSTLYQADAIKAANKKVLGEANANLKIIQPAKDDSALDKKGGADIVKPAAVLARPAARPLALKTVSSQNASAGLTSNTTSVAPVASKPPGLSHISESVADPPKKLVVKKSTKVLKSADTVSQSEVEIKKSTSLLPDTQGGVQLPRQEVRKTETVPLRDEPAARPVAHTDSGIPAGFTSAEEYMMFLEARSNHPQVSHTHFDRAVNVLPSNAVASEPQYYEDDDEDYYYEDGYTSRSFALHGESTGGVTTVLAPRQSEKIDQELEKARTFVETTRTPEDIEDEQWDTSMVAEYGDEIFAYMKSLEQRMAPNPRYMDQQQEIQWSMRAVLIDWVVQVHQRFSLLPETLFLTVNYIDRFLSCKIVSLAKLQLVGATALFVAAKYEEVNCPTIQEIIYMVDNGYSVDELLKAERFMLSMLQFELGWPGPMSFLRRISKADDYDLETRTLAKYFLEITVMDERMVGCAPSFTAAAAHCMARLMLGKGDWTLAHVHFSGYTYVQLRQLLQTMLECCEAPRKHHTAVFDKYADKRFKRASTYVEAQMARGFSLPKASRASSTGYLDGATVASLQK